MHAEAKPRASPRDGSTPPGRTSVRKIWTRVRWALGLVLLLAALLVLRNELRSVRPTELRAAFADLSAAQIAAALLFTMASYVALSGYDFLAARYARVDLPAHLVLSTSFAAHALSNAVGWSLLSGGPIRFRYYGRAGVAPAACARMVAFIATTFWFGAAFLAGLHLALTSPHSGEPLSHRLALIVGLALLACACAYAGWALSLQRLRLGAFQLSPPGPTLLAGQLAVALLDWSLGALVLLALLPARAHVAYPHLLGVYVTSAVVGAVSQSPGGLGVFEGGILFALSGEVEAPRLLASLAAFRAVYDVVPVLGAVLLLALREARVRPVGKVARAIQVLRSVSAPIVPRALAVAAYVAGGILLFSGATPALDPRIHALARILPLRVIELSHFAASLIGAALLVLGRGLQERLDSAWALALSFAVAGSVVSFLKGGDYEEATALLVFAGLLLACRGHFYRGGGLANVRFTLGWAVAILLAVVATTWLGFFSYRHVDYANELWWRFALDADAPRFLRATAGATALLGLFALTRILRPPRRRAPTAGPEDLAIVRAIVERSPRSDAHLALLGDKALLFNSARTGFVMYGVEGHTWVSMGSPVADPSERAALAWQFHALVDRHAGRTVFYQVPSEDLPLYVDLGLSLQRLGEEAVVDLARFSLSGKGQKSVRGAVHRLEREGFAFEIVPPERVPEWLDQLQEVSDAWLGEKRTREKGFSLGHFDAAYLAQTPVAIVTLDGRVMAFANLWEGRAGTELSVDLMRHRPEARHGMMDFLFARIMLDGQARGFRTFNLGMAPFSGLDGRPLAPMWSRMGAFLFRQGEYFYNFRGLRAYKEKFDPEWRPKYLASPGGLSTLSVLKSVAALVSRGLEGVVTR